MTVPTSSLFNDSLKIGDVFTPIEWGEFAIEEYKILSLWLEGKRIFDPTMGEGNLLEAFIIAGLNKGFNVEDLPIRNLFGCEKNKQYCNKAIRKFDVKYNIDMSGNFTSCDYLTYPNETYDIVFGNPPWQNFVDLPESYKEEIKKYFHKYDLIDNAQKLLLGGSRIDIAALIIKKAISDNLVENGKAIFFSPLSILLNDGANEVFRNYKVNDIEFNIIGVHDFNDRKIFETISTRYGLIGFQKNSDICFPIPYRVLENGEWNEYLSKPLLGERSPLSIISKKDDFVKDIKKISVPKKSMPRQGINTCGANEVFFFSSYREVDQNTCYVNDEVELPIEYVYPLITKNNFNQKKVSPAKWVLLPYNDAGKPLSKNELDNNVLLYNYLSGKKDKLANRKGVLINAWIKKGIWWALLGVGNYNFSEYKIVWQAYGKKSFKPILFKGRWQVNQSLQAYIPCSDKLLASQILSDLSSDWVERYLLSLKMEGTMNWAQPGKIKKLLTLHEPQQNLFQCGVPLIPLHE